MQTGRNQYTLYKTMKELKFLLYMLCMTLTVVSCGGSDDDGDDSGNGTPEVNLNKNVVTAGVDKAVTRLEFPKIKGGENLIIVHSTNKYGINYAVEWDCSKKSQRWSCYTMHAENIVRNTDRYKADLNNGEKQYPYDPKLDSKYYFNEDLFWGSNFNHGHICPSADRLCSREANIQTFYLTNMQPQYYNFNAKLWAKMEEKIRNWAPATIGDTLFVCKGGTIDNEKDILTRIQGKLIVPKYFYMAMLLKRRGQYRAIAFFVEHKNEDRSKDALKQYVMSIDKLEERTGIDFFCNLPDNIENNVESSYNINQWGLNN